MQVDFSDEDADVKAREIANVQQSFENEEDLTFAQKRIVALKVKREMKIELKMKCHVI